VPDAAFSGSRNLLFEQRVEYHRRTAGILEAANAVEGVAERRRTRKERVRKT
jgi:hypothetical protein